MNWNNLSLQQKQDLMQSNNPMGCLLVSNLVVVNSAKVRIFGMM